MSESAPRIQVRVSEAGVEPLLLEAAGSRVTIGRSKDCDVILRHSYVSGTHLAIHFGVLAEDLGSSNGTFVGGLPLEGPTLISGRTLTLGGHTLEVDVKVLDGESPMGKLDQAVQRVMTQSISTIGLKPQVPVEFEASNEDSQLLAALVKHDVDGVSALQSEGTTDTFIYEAFAFIRNAERIIATVAGDVTRRPAVQTHMPGSDENFRAVMAALFEDRGRAEARRALEEYLTRMLDWLFASVSAYQSAAVAVVKELQAEMRPSALLSEGDVPLVGRWLRREKVALWERAQERLEGWTASHIVERLEEVAKGEAARHLAPSALADGPAGKDVARET